ncbi:hypothetical protein F2Q68_00004270 [Brassica cretica]|uniref:Uncharacterized protein n=2 Tax=Brassica cretica TaxID=69181 RepID=A0A3N6RRR8_BRACR|nr:hypothetical protein F2Q68_00004270 [Brassica cretica]KAF3499561.1 hypothetical protein F2Q69_00043439 [Brassica cretica]KAF3546028.1 hypothetical protein DY000_02006256 [Brassica cretica]
MASRFAFHQDSKAAVSLRFRDSPSHFLPSIRMIGIREIAFCSTTRSPSMIDGGSGSDRRRG